MRRKVAVFTGMCTVALIGAVPAANASAPGHATSGPGFSSLIKPPLGVTITYTREQLLDLCKSASYPVLDLPNQGLCVSDVELFYKDGLTITGID
jgi:hypothetical protein